MNHLIPELPPHLRNWDVMEPEELPLQVSLLTMELASIRMELRGIAMTLEAMAAAWSGRSE